MKSFKWKNIEEESLIDGRVPRKKARKDAGGNVPGNTTQGKLKQNELRNTAPGGSQTIKEKDGFKQDRNTSFMAFDVDMPVSLDAEEQPSALPDAAYGRAQLADYAVDGMYWATSNPMVPTPSDSREPSLTLRSTPETASLDLLDSSLEDDVEEIIGSTHPPQFFPHASHLNVDRLPISRPTPHFAPTSQWNPFFCLPPQPSFQPSSGNDLMHVFMAQTTSILSVKDGPSENPWRTLIYPLAHSSPPLYHALAALTAFHLASQQSSSSMDFQSLAATKRELRMIGVHHQNQSAKALRAAISANSLSPLSALATTLTLAFAESWDLHIRSGLSHLGGSRILVKQVLAAHRENRFEGEDKRRMEFLANAWVYLDVLVQLTSMCDDTGNCSVDFEGLLAPLNSDTIIGPEPPTGLPRRWVEVQQKLPIDPLLGCARSLFPLLSRVGELCKKVRTLPNSHRNLLTAQHLKLELETWDPGDISAYHSPEDTASPISHSLATAEAYRLSSLILLYQAVPPLLPSSDTVNELAGSVMQLIDRTPISSRVVVVQVLPLLVASCEAEGEQRDWARERWRGMKVRMWTGNVEKGEEVCKEIWRRRDVCDARSGGREGREYGVGGRLHWGSVMRDWGWEGMLSLILPTFLLKREIGH